MKSSNEQPCYCGTPSSAHDVACPVAEAERAKRDQRVLDAMSAIPRAKLQSWIDRGFASVLELAKAELARREGGKT